MTIKVFEFGAKEPTVNLEGFENQIWLAHRYYNDLIKLENDLRKKRRELFNSSETIKNFNDKISKFYKELNSLRDEIKEENTKNKSRTNTKEQREKIKELKKEIKNQTAKLKEEKNLFCQKNKEELDKLVKEKNKAIKKKDNGGNLRGKSGVYCGTYSLIERSHNQAIKSKKDPRFRKWNNSGQIEVVLEKKSGNFLMRDICAGKNGMLKIEEVSDNVWQTWKEDLLKKREVELKKNPQIKIVKIRIGSVDKTGKVGIYTEFTAKFHREIPLDAIITHASLKKENHAGKGNKWKLHLTVELPEKTSKNFPEKEAVAIDIGWRKCEEGIRAGYSVTSDELEEEILLDNKFLEGFKKIEDLQSIRDKELNKLKEYLLPWVSENKDNFSENLKNKFQNFHLWKSHERFSKFIWAWKDNRILEDENVFDMAEKWRKQNKHLYDWQVNFRKKLLLRRREQYRILSSRLSKEYKCVVIEKMNLKHFSRKEQPESQKQDNKTARVQKINVSHSELRQSLENAFGKNRVVKVDPKYTTKECHFCGQIDEWENKADKFHTCSKCGKTWDRDINAGYNLLKRFRAVEYHDTIEEETQEKRPSSWGKRKSKKAENEKQSNRSQNGLEVVVL